MTVRKPPVTRNLAEVSYIRSKLGPRVVSEFLADAAVYPRAHTGPKCLRNSRVKVIQDSRDLRSLLRLAHAGARPQSSARNAAGAHSPWLPAKPAYMPLHTAYARFRRHWRHGP